MSDAEKALKFDRIKEIINNRKWCGCHPEDILMYIDVCKIMEIVGEEEKTIKTNKED